MFGTIKKINFNRKMMELNTEDLTLIERFLDKQLNETDMAKFTQRRATDTDFNAVVKSYEEAILAVKLAHEDKITAILKEEQAKFNQAKVIPIDKNKPKTFSILSRPVVMKLKASRGSLAAASIAALLIVGYWFITKDIIKPLSPLVAANFEPYPALGITRGENDNNVKSEALRTYAVNDFKHAMPLLQKAFDVERDTMLLFYKGIAALGVNDPNNALAIFTSLQNQQTIPSEMIEWYLALTYIELGQKEKALPLLQKVGNTEGGNREKAVALLEKLK
jgi:tetratricopeptide (TPR) repeat protein